MRPFSSKKRRPLADRAYMSQISDVVYKRSDCFFFLIMPSFCCILNLYYKLKCMESKAIVIKYEDKICGKWCKIDK